MNFFAVIFLLTVSIGILTVPRQWIAFPLLAGACYITNAQSIDVGPFHFTVLRILIILGLLRSGGFNLRLPGGFLGMDRLIIAWAIWYLISSAFHAPVAEALVFRMGIVYNVLGIYFLIRASCREISDLRQFVKITSLVLVPVALEMIVEKVTHRNAFAMFGGVPLEVVEREGKFRAQGPFGHPILAGTVGAVCIPLMVGIWRLDKKSAKIGLAAAMAMVVTSTSSGPIMTTILGVGALILWKWKQHVGRLRILAVVIYIICNILMTRPAYYLMTKIDLTGSSTAYHRAALIESGINHFDEWWLAGTDVTRHWMPTGVPGDETKTDITNNYLLSGVNGGIILLLLFAAMMLFGFIYVSRSMRLTEDRPFNERFLIWAVGSTLFAHSITMLSVAYFDQSGIFLYTHLAIATSLYGVYRVAANKPLAA